MREKTSLVSARRDGIFKITQVAEVGLKLLGGYPVGGQVTAMDVQGARIIVGHANGGLMGLSLQSKTNDDVVCRRPDSMPKNSGSVLVLGKDHGASMDLLKKIAACLKALEYEPILIREQAGRPGELLKTKVMRYATAAKFVVVENTEPSGHLYEIAHVDTAACVTVVLQEQGKGATWIFEDADENPRNWRKIEYKPDALESAINSAAEWAEDRLKRVNDFQEKAPPWMR